MVSGSHIVGYIMCDGGKQFILYFNFSHLVEGILRLFEFITGEGKCVGII